MYVSKLKIQGMRGFAGSRSVDIDFTRPDGSYAGWTVLAGRNGSGKTTMLQAIALALAGENFVQDLDSWLGVGQSRRAFISSTIIQDAQFDGGLDFGPQELKIEWNEETSRNRPVWSHSSTRRRSPRQFSQHDEDGWLYAGYGPFRRLSSTALGRVESKSSARYAGLRTLFDEDISLVEGVGWLIEQHLYNLEKKSGAKQTLEAALAIIGDGMLPEGYQVSRVDSAGLWVRQNNATEIPLRQMSDGYRTVTALVLDIIRQMSVAFQSLRISEQGGRPTLPYPGVVLIDEVDAHLHVSWQKYIGEWLKTHFPRIQFIVTTHSPYVCQSADSGGLIRLAGPDEQSGPRVVDQDLYQRIVYGSGDDAILTELFGVETPYSAEAEKIRGRIAYLEDKVLNGEASPEGVEEYRRLSERLTSSLSARIDEVAARLGRGA